MNRKASIPVKTIVHIKAMMIVGSRIAISVFLTIIPVGVPIGDGIMGVCTHRTGIHGTGVLPFMSTIIIIHITGDIGIRIEGIITEDTAGITIIRARLRHVTSVIKEGEMVQGHLVPQDQRGMEMQQLEPRAAHTLDQIVEI